MGVQDANALSGEQQNRVFVVHGRNLEARDSMFDFLGSLGLSPIEWDQAVARTGSGSPYIGQVLDAAFDEGQAVVVLLTPDDIAYLQPSYASGEDDPELRPAGQARPNVLFEAGMAMGRDDRRTIMVELGDLRPFSDVAGRHAVRLTNQPKHRKALAQRLKTAGCPVDLSGDRWLEVGNFDPPPKPGGGLPLGRKVPTTEKRGASVDASWYPQGGSKLDLLKITNHGTMPILDIRVEVPDDLDIKLWTEDPPEVLPVGKTYTVRAYIGRAPDQFELPVSGRLESGESFRQVVYLDTVG